MMTDTIEFKRQGWTELRRKIERYACEHDLTFLQAGRIFTRNRDNLMFVMEALGGWYRGKPPSDQTIRRLKDENLVFLAKRWPDAELKGSTKDELHYKLLPYLPRSKRSPPKPGRDTTLRQKAKDHFARGYSRTEIAKMLGISRATVYRWFSKDKTKAIGQTAPL